MTADDDCNDNRSHRQQQQHGDEEQQRSACCARPVRRGGNDNDVDNDDYDVTADGRPTTERTLLLDGRPSWDIDEPVHDGPCNHGSFSPRVAPHRVSETIGGRLARTDSEAQSFGGLSVSTVGDGEDDAMSAAAGRTLWWRVFGDGMARQIAKILGRLEMGKAQQRRMSERRRRRARISKWVVFAPST
jgi:hypothetical protein